MKKKIDETALMSELRRESSFFREAAVQQGSDPVELAGETGAPAPPTKPSPAHATVVERAHEPAMAPHPEELIDAIRRAVKAIGKEESTIRLTREEKMELKDIQYTFLRRGRPTSGNELYRIALHALLADYREHGEESILTRVIEALAS